MTNGAGDCVAPDDCTETCVAMGARCGELCGSPCGTCAEGQACASGACVCAPSCDGTRCDDGCGGPCPCADGRVCDATGACVAPADCEGTCETERAVCGSVCGEFCGPCADTLTCQAGACVRAESCPDCALVLRMTSRVVVGSLIEQVTLAVDYQPSEGEPHPRLVDLRLGLPAGAQVLGAAPGSALVLAGKSLEVDAVTGKPWRLRTDGSVQLLALALGNTTELATGRLVTLDVELDHPGPVEFRLLRHPQTFAPERADGALQATAYDTPLTVTR